jgi:hypothetical protein
MRWGGVMEMEGAVMRNRLSVATWGPATAGLAIVLVGGGCGSRDPARGDERSDARLELGESSEAKAMLSRLQARPDSPLQAAAATAFRIGPDSLTPRFPTAAEQPRARVLLPALATSSVHIEDVASGLAVDVTLNEARRMPAQAAGGYLVYPRAHASGATLLHRATPDGDEDFVSFETRPLVAGIAYTVALGPQVRGLRLVADTLEMLDADGAPRLRVSAPYVVGADGARIDASLALEGCAADTIPAAPWGRSVTAPGASACTLRVTWPAERVAYPAVLDPRWTTTGSLSVARQEHTAIQLSTGRVLVVGGRSSGGTTALASAELYDRTTGTWAATASMTGARRLHSATQLPTSSNPTTSGKILIAGGINGTTSLTTAQLYSPTAGTWVAAADLNAARHGHTATLLATGRVLVAGGMNGTTTLQTAAVYNPSSGSGSWAATTGPIPPPGLRNHTATLLATSNQQLNNKVLLVGGNNGSATLAAVYLFDPAQSAFSTLASLPSPREGHSATLLPNGKLLVTGGRNGATTLATAVVFDPGVGPGSWSSAGTMTSPRSGHTATLLAPGTAASGQVLVAGGSNGTSSLSSAELFSGTSTWAATAALPGAVQGHTATLLASGAVLVAGGVSGTTVLSAARLYDPSSGLACTSGGQCATGFCVNGVCCDTACNGGCGACNLPGTVGVCSPIAAGPVCRAQMGSCDVAETCNGTSVSCPADQKAADGTSCSDGLSCTQDQCQTGVCVGAPVVCTPIDDCHDAGTCDPGTGVCSNPLKPVAPPGCTAGTFFQDGFKLVIDNVAPLDPPTGATTVDIASCGHGVMYATRTDGSLWFNIRSGAAGQWVRATVDGAGAVNQDASHGLKIACDRNRLYSVDASGQLWQAIPRVPGYFEGGADPWSSSGFGFPPAPPGGPAFVTEIQSGMGNIYALRIGASTGNVLYTSQYTVGLGGDLPQGSEASWITQASNLGAVVVTGAGSLELEVPADRAFALNPDGSLSYNDNILNVDPSRPHNLWTGFPNGGITFVEITADAPNVLYGMTAAHELYRLTFSEDACDDTVANAPNHNPDNDANGLTNAADRACSPKISAQLCNALGDGTWCYDRAIPDAAAPFAPSNRAAAVCQGGTVTTSYGVCRRGVGGSPDAIDTNEVVPAPFGIARWCSMTWPDGTWDFQWGSPGNCDRMNAAKPGGTIYRAGLYDDAAAQPAARRRARFRFRRRRSAGGQDLGARSGAGWDDVHVRRLAGRDAGPDRALRHERPVASPAGIQPVPHRHAHRQSAHRRPRLHGPLGRARRGDRLPPQGRDSDPCNGRRDRHVVPGPRYHARDQRPRDPVPS